jgi:hypothetical protein
MGNYIWIFKVMNKCRKRRQNRHSFNARAKTYLLFLLLDYLISTFYVMQATLIFVMTN